LNNLLKIKSNIFDIGYFNIDSCSLKHVLILINFGCFLFGFQSKIRFVIGFLFESLKNKKLNDLQYMIMIVILNKLNEKFE